MNQPLYLCGVLLALGLLAQAETRPIAKADLDALERAQAAQVEKLDAALARTPDVIRLLSARGDAHLFLGHFAAAVADYEKMIALDPAEDAPHWRLGIAYYFAGQWEKSSRQFAKYRAYDGHDRENGIWKFLADVQWHGLEAARRDMLAYTAFDREPFPALYDLLAGKLTPAEFTGRLAKKKLTEDRQVMFFAHYYGGMNEEVLGRHEAALQKLREAVALYSPAEAGRDGPGFMWQAARLQCDLLRRASTSRSAASPTPGPTP